MRNSSLVEWLCAEYVPGLSIIPKLRIRNLLRVVGERSMGDEGRSKGLLERIEVRMPV